MSTVAVVQVVAALAFPGIARWAAGRFKPLSVVGPVVLCYGAGILFGNLVELDQRTSLSISEAAVPLAIPLMLFASDVPAWLKLARPLLISFALACVSAVVCAGAVGVAFRAGLDEWWKIAGMLVGVYVGGTANMSAIGLALDTRKETFVLLNASDVLCGGAYLLLLLTVAQRLLLRFLPAFVEPPHDPDAPLPVKAQVTPLRRGFGVLLSAVIVGGSVGAVLLVLGRMSPGPILFLITALGTAASFIPAIRNLPGTADTGEYVLLIFCFAVGSLADVRQISGTSVQLFGFVALVMVCAIAMHVGLSKLFKLDADTTIIASTATIFGPAFIGPVAAALKNRHLVGPGLSMGLAGIALGTYLGLATAYALEAIFGTV